MRTALQLARLQLLVTQAHLHHPWAGRTVDCKSDDPKLLPTKSLREKFFHPRSQLGHRVTFARQMLGTSSSSFFASICDSAAAYSITGNFFFFFFSFRALQLWMHILRGSVSWQINRPQKYFAETSEPETPEIQPSFGGGVVSGWFRSFSLAWVSEILGTKFLREFRERY